MQLQTSEKIFLHSWESWNNTTLSKIWPRIWHSSYSILIDNLHIMKFNENMDDVKKMFRTIVNGQSAMKQELLTEIKKVHEKLTGRIDSLSSEMKNGFKKVNRRLDTIGKNVAYLEDDAPTIEEFNKLEKRVSRLETRTVKN